MFSFNVTSHHFIQHTFKMPKNFAIFAKKYFVTSVSILHDVTPTVLVLIIVKLHCVLFETEMEKPRFLKKVFRFLNFCRCTKGFVVLVYKEDGSQILRPILYTILRVTSCLLSEWCDAKTHKSRLRYKLNLICIIKCTTN